MEITIPLDISIIGGMLSVLLFAVVVWLALRAIQAAIFWAALGGIPIFKITGTLLEMTIAGKSISEIGDKIATSIIFFLKPLDDLMADPSYDWKIKIPIAIILIIWLIMCIRWSAKTLASNWLYVNGLWGIPIGVSLWYVLTGTAVGFRTSLASMLPVQIASILLDIYGLYIILLSILIVIPISYIQYRRSQITV